MVRIDWFEGPRAALAELFALADDSPLQVQRYRQLGRVLVAREGTTVVGHLQLIAGDRADGVEVKSLAVREDRQGTGVGQKLMERAILICRRRRCDCTPRDRRRHTRRVPERNPRRYGR